jgi:hypothetical protein
MGMTVIAIIARDRRYRKNTTQPLPSAKCLIFKDLSGGPPGRLVLGKLLVANFFLAATWYNDLMVAVKETK